MIKSRAINVLKLCFTNTKIKRQ